MKKNTKTKEKKQKILVELKRQSNKIVSGTKTWVLVAIIAILILILLSQKIYVENAVAEKNEYKKTVVEKGPALAEIKYEEQIFLDAAHTYDIDIGDIDKDGFIDIVAANYNGKNIVYFNNKGDGTFTKQFLDMVDYTKSIKIADMNDDDYPDIVVGNYNEPSYIYLNKKDRTFYLSKQLDKAYVEDLIVADINNDGYMDILIGTNFKENVLYLGNKDGNYDRKIWGDKMHIKKLLPYDYNKDSYLDFIVGADAETTKIFLNNKDGSFGVVKELGSGVEHNYDMALIDYDKDGVMDLVQGNNEQQNYLWDRVETQMAFFETGNTYAVAVADLNNDGWDDVIIGNYEESIDIYINSGGKFVLSKRLEVGTRPFIHDIVVADINNDGKKDIVVAKDKQDSEVWLG